MKKLRSWYSGVFRSQAEHDEFAGKGRPTLVQPRHASRWQTCDDQLSIRAGRQQRGSKARFHVLAERTWGQRQGKHLY